MTRKLILSFDLDNVIRDSIRAIIDNTFKRYGKQLYRDQFDQWDPQLGTAIGISQDEFFNFAWYDRVNYGLACQPVAGSRSVLQELSKTAHIIINTSNPYQDLTYEWLDHWLIPYDDVIHTNDKNSVEFDVHVDDSPIVLEQLYAAGRQVIRFAVPWNAHLNGKYPVATNWDELNGLLQRPGSVLLAAKVVSITSAM